MFSADAPRAPDRSPTYQPSGGGAYQPSGGGAYRAPVRPVASLKASRVVPAAA